MKSSKTTVLEDSYPINEVAFGGKNGLVTMDELTPADVFCETGHWTITIEFTPEADLELERCCTCPVEGLGIHAWYGPCADGKGHAHQCAVAIAAMKEAKWPCGKLKYPELSES